MAKISPKSFADAIYAVTANKSGQDLAATLRRSAQILKNKQMLGKSGEVLSYLQKIFDKKTGTVRAKVTSGKSMGGAERSKLTGEIKDKYRAQIVISEFFENSEVLGGVKVEVGDEVFDGTYKNKLQKLENFLMHSK